MVRSLTGLTFFAFVGAVSIHATDLPFIIKRVSDNCDKIESFKARLDARYHD